MDDEKYFKLIENNVVKNRYFYSTDPTTTPPKVNFQCKTEFELKVMIRIGMSSKGASDIYVHRSKQAANQETHLKECTDKRLLPQIPFEWKLFVSDKAHYSNNVQERLIQNNIPFFARVGNPSKLVQLRLSELYLNERYMKTIGKQKLLIIWLKESNKKAKER